LGSAFRVIFFQLIETGAQSFRIELAYGKRSNAALHAAQMTHKPVATTARRIIKSRIHDLYKLLIACGKHLLSIAILDCDGVKEK
jgi:hypothetical protein